MRQQRSTDFQERIGQRINFLREKLNMSQTELGKYSNIDHNTIGQYERGKKSIGAQCLQDIMDALGVDATKFFRSKLFAKVIKPLGTVQK